MSFEKASPEREMFKEFYDICVKFWEPNETSEYWDAVIDAVVAFDKKGYPSLTRGLGKSLLDYLETKYKEEKRQNEQA